MISSNYFELVHNFVDFYKPKENFLCLKDY